MTPEQRERLPVYAQRELTRLERTVADLRARLDPGTDSDTRTEAGDPLGNGARVRWTMPDGTYYLVGPAKRGEGELEVMFGGGGSLSAVGVVSNVLGLLGLGRRG